MADALNAAVEWIVNVINNIKEEGPKTINVQTSASRKISMIV